VSGGDREAARPSARSAAPLGPAHRHWGLLALICAGGGLGTYVRAVLEQAAPPQPGGIPWTTFTINVTGSLALGALLEVLTRTGRDSGWRRAVRLTVGTGFLGGYTTYSTFAVEVTTVSATAPHAWGAVYAVSSVVLGVVAAGLGYAAAHRIRRSPLPRDELDA
jgi:CrcB protein